MATPPAETLPQGHLRGQRYLHGPPAFRVVRSPGVSLRAEILGLGLTLSDLPLIAF